MCEGHLPAHLPQCPRTRVRARKKPDGTDKSEPVRLVGGAKSWVQAILSGLLAAYRLHGRCRIGQVFLDLGQIDAKLLRDAASVVFIGTEEVTQL